MRNSNGPPVERRLTLGRVILAVLGAAASPHHATAQAVARELTGELFVGTAWSLPLQLSLERPDERMEFRAHYETRPLADAPYYAYRFGFTQDGHGGEAELVHHKLYLTNPRPPIEQFEVTHGYNLLLGNLVAPAHGWQARVGLGFVVAHPEGRIAGRPVRGARRTFLRGGYHIAGVALQLAFGRRYALGRGDVALTVAPEAKLTAALAQVPLEQGMIRVPNVAFHALGGFGVRRRW